MRRIALAGLLLLGLFGTRPAFANAELCAAPPCTPVPKIVRVGYTKFPPFSDTNDRGTAQGYSIDLMRQFLEPQGYALLFVEHDNPAQMLESLTDGVIDATSLLGVNEDRMRIGTFSDTFEQYSSSIFVRSGTAPIVDNEDLTGLRVGVSRGSLLERMLADMPDVLVVPVSNNPDLFLSLLAGEVDAIAGPTQALQYQINVVGLNDRIESTSLRLHSVDAAILVRPDLTRLRSDLNAAIAAAQDGGQISQLRAKWFSKPPRVLSPNERRLFILTTAVLCVLLLLWIKAYLRVRRSARLLDTRTRQLQKALDATGATFLIADKDMKVLWWNEACVALYPQLKNVAVKGLSFEEYIFFQSAPSVLRHSAEHERAAAGEKAARLRAGEELTSVSTTAEGHVIRQRMFKLPDGEYAAIGVDVSELTEERDLIRRDADRLEQTNQRLERFSQMVAHDLVAPIRNQRLLLDFIREDLAHLDVDMPSELHESFEQADRLLERQSQLVTDLLEWTRTLQAGKAQVFSPTGRAMNAVTLAAVPPGFTVHMPEDMPRLSASPITWELVMRNLISNAVKHHDRLSGEIRISHRSENGFCVFRVSDDGPGIPPEYLSRVFNPFETLKSKDDGGGSGLGLSFVREAVEAWGGEVSALDTKGGRGACFRFTVPLADDPVGSEDVRHDNTAAITGSTPTAPCNVTAARNTP